VKHMLKLVPRGLRTHLVCSCGMEHAFVDDPTPEDVAAVSAKHTEVRHECRVLRWDKNCIDDDTIMVECKCGWSIRLGTNPTVETITESHAAHMLEHERTT
jgi:hypothetical protein